MHRPRLLAAPVLTIAVAAAATGCLSLEADLTSSTTLSNVVPAAAADGSCAAFRPRADATVYVEGVESSDPTVRVNAYLLPVLGPGSSTGVAVWSSGKGMRVVVGTVSAGQYYGVKVDGSELQAQLPGGPPPAPWSTHVKVVVTAQDAAGDDVPLDCGVPTPPAPSPTEPHGY